MVPGGVCSRGSLVPKGWSGPGGGCLLPGGGVSAPGGCLEG